MKTLKRIFSTLIDLDHILTPFAVEHLKRTTERGTVTIFRVVYIFGVRIAYYSTVKFQ